MKKTGMGKNNATFRLSLALKGPHLFDIVEVIGKRETISKFRSNNNIIKNAPKIISLGHFHY
jgi:glutamyl-tRNA synthetase